MGFVLNHYFWVWFWLESLVLGFGLNHWFWVLVWITRGFGLNHWFWVYWWRMVTKFWVCVLMPMSMSMPLFCSWSVVSGLWTVVLGSWILLMVSRRWSIVVGFHSSFFFFFFTEQSVLHFFFFFNLLLIRIKESQKRKRGITSQGMFVKFTHKSIIDKIQTHHHRCFRLPFLTVFGATAYVAG